MTGSTARLLQAHPATPCPAVHRLQVTIGFHALARVWRLHYELHADLAQLKLPPGTGHPGAREGLWRHTCFEAFVGHPEASAYREFNLAPSGDWAIYDFSDERVRMPNRQELSRPRIDCRHGHDALMLDAWLLQDDLPAGDRLQLGLAAVIETRDGQLSHWALIHLGQQADFHDRRGWTASLATPLLA